MINLFHEVSQQCSRLTTEKYSTSFSSAIRLLHKDLRRPIYNIYGFVRFADEIVDTFHGYEQSVLLQQFRQETLDAIEKKISLNPILHSFQMTVNQYHIDLSLVNAFFNSMEMDLKERSYDNKSYSEYIFGSAEVVGLMCLYVFCDGNLPLFQKLEPSARALGAAFQKVNFLRDLKSDYVSLKRIYFPGVDFNNFTEKMKRDVEDDIARDFQNAYSGILKLPLKARFGVYVAYKYYLSLYRKIRRVKSHKILEARIRIPNYRKAMIVFRAGVKNQLKLI